MSTILLITRDERLTGTMQAVSREEGWDLTVSDQFPPAEEYPGCFDLLAVDVRPDPSGTFGFIIGVSVMVTREAPVKADRFLAMGHYEDAVGRMNAYVHGASGYLRIHLCGVLSDDRLAHTLRQGVDDVLSMPPYRQEDFHAAFPNREFYRSALESMVWPLLILSTDGRIKVMNLRALSMFDYPTQAVIDQDWSMLIAPMDRGARAKEALLRFTGGYFNEFRLYLVDRHGNQFPALITSSRVFPPKGQPSDPHIILSISDLTAVEELQRQLATYQRVESVERVVAGMTHEFSNLLTAIFGHAELMVEDLPEGSELRESAEVIRRECERAQDLTGRLLGLGGTRQFVPEPVSCNEIALSTRKLMQHSLGDQIGIETDLMAEGDVVEGDPGQLQQVLVNLCLNARDAIGDEGTITLQTSVRDFTPDDCRGHEDWTPGIFVEMAVSDTGCGMTREMIDRVVEPFFTTKPSGAGSGLGLTVVRGIVRSHSGQWAIESVPDEGTTVRVWLPQSDAKVGIPGTAVGLPAAEVEQMEEEEGEGVLVVDDEQSVVVYVQRVLQRNGYHVHPVTNADMALEILQRHRDKLSLIILDLTMPGMTGRDLLLAVRGRGDDIPIILSTGFAHGGIDDEMVGMVQGFLKKPYRPQELVDLVREVLESAKSE
jgi:PAS domain S-box-containing protein